MYKSGYDWSKPFRKSARIVGDVMVNTIHMETNQFMML